MNLTLYHSPKALILWLGKVLATDRGTGASRSLSLRSDQVLPGIAPTDLMHGPEVICL